MAARNLPQIIMRIRKPRLGFAKDSRSSMGTCPSSAEV
jgi:hypothetical protein